MEIRRKALIINNDRNPGDANILTGNICDVSRCASFLKTSYGGAWSDSEVFESPTNYFTKESLIEYIKNEINDNGINYWLIVFTGHGATFDNGSQSRGVIQLAPGHCCEVDAIISVLACTRALLVIDGCRTIQMITEGRAPVPTAICDYGDMNYRAECRLLYNQALERIPENTQYVSFSCSEGQEAKSSSTIGSLYLFLLIHFACSKARFANTVRNAQFLTAKPQLFPFRDIHFQTANEVINITKGTQSPEYLGDDIPPFIVIPGFIK